MLAVGLFTTVPGDIADAGGVELFKRAGNAWIRATQLRSPTPELGTGFADALALSGRKLVVGAPKREVTGAVLAGSLRVIDTLFIDCQRDGLPDLCQIANASLSDANGNNIPDDCEAYPCFGDFNDSGQVGTQDIFDYLVEYFAGNLTADTNNSGQLTIQDLFAFLQQWFRGCP